MYFDKIIEPSRAYQMEVMVCPNTSAWAVHTLSAKETLLPKQN